MNCSIRAAMCGLTALAVLAGPAAAQPAKIDFAHDIVPLLKARCAECHTNGKYKGSFSLDTRETTCSSRRPSSPARAATAS